MAPKEEENEDTDDASGFTARSRPLPRPVLPTLRSPLPASPSMPTSDDAIGFLASRALEKREHDVDGGERSGTPAIITVACNDDEELAVAEVDDGADEDEAASLGFVNAPPLVRASVDDDEANPSIASPLTLLFSFIEGREENAAEVEAVYSD